MRLIKFLAAPRAVSLAAYLWLAPGFIEIDIPVARHKGGMGFWWESHRTSIFPRPTGGFTVALTTANESLLMRMSRLLD